MNGANDREAMLELIAAAALGVLPEADRARVDAFILADPAARAEFEELRAAADIVGLAAEAPPDSARAARMKARLLASVQSTAPVPATVTAQRRRPAPSVVWISALAAAAALVFALISTMQSEGLRSERDDANRRAQTLQQQVTAERNVVERDGRILADLTASDAKSYAVPYGSVVTRGSHLYLALHALPPLPRGHVYQAWTLPRGATAVAPSLTFTPTETGTTLVPLPEDATKTAAIAVSVEPAGGSRAPTTKPAFVQPLS